MRSWRALGGALCSGALWRRLSGPQEQRLLQQASCGLVAFVAAAMVLARFVGVPYGRYSSPAFGWRLPARASWLVQEAPSCLVPVLLIVCSDGARLAFCPNRVLLALFVAHYFYRAFIFPLLIRGGKSMPLLTFVMAFIFCSCNGYLQGRKLSNYAEYPSDWCTDPRFILAWLGGLLINVHSDHILRELRKPGETGYKIPRGGLFEYVTCANYFGEIVEWCGFAIACCTVESLAFAISTFLILVSRACKHHKWYLNKFEDYPRSRKIIIPFVF
uniref:3-oxo-5alpha-steroid 4-dehydrogenase (NADP(+)) n=1 Tax=Varanus komodoensis TaxID=61221 RepID=A0A8D2IV58_VARKO